MIVSSDSNIAKLVKDFAIERTRLNMRIRQLEKELKELKTVKEEEPAVLIPRKPRFTKAQLNAIINEFTSVGIEVIRNEFPQYINGWNVENIGNGRRMVKDGTTYYKLCLTKFLFDKTGLNNRQIGKIFGVTHSAVIHRLNKYESEDICKKIIYKIYEIRNSN